MKRIITTIMMCAMFFVSTFSSFTTTTALAATDGRSKFINDYKDELRSLFENVKDLDYDYGNSAFLAVWEDVPSSTVNEWRAKTPNYLEEYLVTREKARKASEQYYNILQDYYPGGNFLLYYLDPQDQGLFLFMCCDGFVLADYVIGSVGLNGTTVEMYIQNVDSELIKSHNGYYAISSDSNDVTINIWDDISQEELKRIAIAECFNLKEMFKLPLHLRVNRLDPNNFNNVLEQYYDGKNTISYTQPTASSKVGVPLDVFVARYNTGAAYYNQIADRDGYVHMSEINATSVLQENYQPDAGLGYKLTIDKSNNGDVCGFGAFTMLNNMSDKNVLTGEIMSCIYALDTSLTDCGQALEIWGEIAAKESSYINSIDYVNLSGDGISAVNGAL